MLSWIGFKDSRATSFLSFSIPSFNPCCRGLGSKTTLRHHRQTGLRSGFNPCCRGLGSKTTGAAAAIISTGRFQSLLSWIGFKDVVMGWSWCLSMQSFNPCCRGLGSKTSRSGANGSGAAAVSILVVVDWVQRLGLRIGCQCVNLCFNPCCRGLGSETRLVLCSGWRQATVSILVVVDWVQRPVCQSLRLQAIQVSILVVVDWVQRLVAEERRDVFVPGFQSLLSWIGFRDVAPSQHRRC